MALHWLPAANPEKSALSWQYLSELSDMVRSQLLAVGEGGDGDGGGWCGGGGGGCAPQQPLQSSHVHFTAQAWELGPHQVGQAMGSMPRPEHSVQPLHEGKVHFVAGGLVLRSHHVSHGADSGSEHWVQAPQPCHEHRRFQFGFRLQYDLQKVGAMAGDAICGEMSGSGGALNTKGDAVGAPRLPRGRASDANRLKARIDGEMGPGGTLGRGPGLFF